MAQAAGCRRKWSLKGLIRKDPDRGSLLDRIAGFGWWTFRTGQGSRQRSSGQALPGGFVIGERAVDPPRERRENRRKVSRLACLNPVGSGRVAGRNRRHSAPCRPEGPPLLEGLSIRTGRFCALRQEPNPGDSEPLSQKSCLCGELLMTGIHLTMRGPRGFRIAPIAETTAFFRAPNFKSQGSPRPLRSNDCSQC